MQIPIRQMLMTKYCLLSALPMTVILSATTATHECAFSGAKIRYWLKQESNLNKTFTWTKRQPNIEMRWADIIRLLTFPCSGGLPKILVNWDNWFRQLALVDIEANLFQSKKIRGSSSLRSAGHDTEELFRANLQLRRMPLTRLHNCGFTLETCS